MRRAVAVEDLPGMGVIAIAVARDGLLARAGGEAACDGAVDRLVARLRVVGAVVGEGPREADGLCRRRSVLGEDSRHGR